MSGESLRCGRARRRLGWMSATREDGRDSGGWRRLEVDSRDSGGWRRLGWTAGTRVDGRDSGGRRRLADGTDSGEDGRDSGGRQGLGWAAPTRVGRSDSGGPQRPGWCVRALRRSGIACLRWPEHCTADPWASRRCGTPTPCPQGEEKVAAVRSMFDAIAPRYDLVNRIMTFRLDVGWRRKAVDLLALPPGSTVLDLACGTGDLCLDLARVRPSADGVRPLLRDARRGDRSGAPRVQADVLRLPVRRRRGRRRHLRLRPAQPRRPPGRSSTSWAGWCAAAGASPCSTSATRPTR